VKMRHLSYLWLCLLLACSSSLPQRQQRAEEKARALLKELRQIRSRDELMGSRSRIAKLYAQLAQALVDADQYYTSHPDEELRPAPPDLNSELKQELQRLYAMEGGRELLELAQEQALERLSAQY
jgi:hypothetical protein